GGLMHRFYGYIPGLAAVVGMIFPVYEFTPVLKIKTVGDLLLIPLIIHITYIEKNLLSIGELSDRKHGIGSGTLIIPGKPASYGHYTGRVGIGYFRIKSPISHIQLMCTLVVQFPVSHGPGP